MHAIGWQSSGERVDSPVDSKDMSVGEKLAAGSLEGRSKEISPWLLHRGNKKISTFHLDIPVSEPKLSIIVTKDSFLSLPWRCHFFQEKAARVMVCRFDRAQQSLSC